MRIVGLDPAFANFGMVSGSLLRLRTDKWAITINTMLLLQTEKLSGKKSSMRVSSDVLRRAQEIHTGLHEFLEEHRPELVFAEVPSGAQSAAAGQALGVAVGVLGSIRVPLIEVTPMEVKRLFTARRESIPKEHITAWAIKHWPDAPWLKTHGKLVKKNEHLADACATIQAGVGTDTFKQLLAMRGLNEIPLSRDDRSAPRRQPVDGVPMVNLSVAQRTNQVTRRKVLEDLG